MIVLDYLKMQDVASRHVRLVLAFSCVMAHNVPMKTIQDIIKNHRKQTHMSIAKFTCEAGVCPSTYHYLMTNKHEVSLKLIQKMLNVCGYELYPRVKPICDNSVHKPNE